MDANFAVIKVLFILLITEPDGSKAYTGPWAEFICLENEVHAEQARPGVEAECVPYFDRRNRP